MRKRAPPRASPRTLGRRKRGLALAGLVAGTLVAGLVGARWVGSGDARAESWPPAVGAPDAGSRPVRVLHNPGFVVGYDTRRRRAAWVAFRLRGVGAFASMQRPRFRPDPRLGAAPWRGVYRRPHIDRGHMAPNYAMRQLYGVKAQRASFYLSNIEPQRSRLNQLDWQRLEEIEIDALAPAHAPLWVVAGPVPAPAGAMPSAFYRIWLARGDDGRWQALAFRLPQRVRGDERLSRFIVSIDAIETATDLDFFPRLNAATQRRLEAAPAPATTLGFGRYACAPARYRDDWQGRDGIDLRYDRCR